MIVTDHGRFGFVGQHRARALLHFLAQVGFGLGAEYLRTTQLHFQQAIAEGGILAGSAFDALQELAVEEFITHILWTLDETQHAPGDETLAELGDGSFIDTRVILAHKRIEVSREDRFLSDLGRWQDIRDPFLRDFPRAALEAPIPVLLGGHSLMSGGLMALNEYAWKLSEAHN